ncbi:hypothetical protein CRP01_01655 [Flavilitoribacter nigricans DSM 23189 = NBRC 102662]|uniref:Uncharacterized protein n=1 Tax=Flavilitoribacter nigricans (strain ATCC 23147 / DSM 23189 / NBRC 102662 / NCIMB 1420 / SS-2) TaxID=1122177 RepID=A0A2D0NLM4_FLAN2|nr:hypothetical protein CRP01_01655 [Flavilitoribacter nigricans DSM 23189 = NBRC 102662]
MLVKSGVLSSENAGFEAVPARKLFRQKGVDSRVRTRCPNAGVQDAFSHESPSVSKSKVEVLEWVGIM